MKWKYAIYIIIYLILIISLYHNEIIIKEQELNSEEGWIDIFFCQKTNCSSIIIELIKQSNNTICAFYDLDEKRIIDSLNESKVVIFEENSLEQFQSVSSKGLMHHKFCTFDNNIILTGTWNPTMRGTYKNDNAIIISSSKSLSEFYNLEYEHLKDREIKTETKHINLSGSIINAYLCPQDNCENKVVDEINSAEKSIEILAFSFTSKNIADALILAKNRSVDIKVVFEKTRISKYSQYEYLLSNNISVWKDGNKYVMHEKTFLIDNETLIIGSYNPTANANTRNDENILIIQDENLIKKMNEEFNRILNEIPTV